MITKLILTTALVIGAAHGSVDATLSTNPNSTMNEKIQHSVWNPTIDKKASGKSCKDGNCMTKDGKMYKFFTSVRNKVKKEFKKL